MISSFSQFLVEEEKTVYFTFGRLNPPTMGHEMLLNKLAKAAGRNPYKIYLSKSSDPKKNPLSYNDKIKFARKMFPKHARQIIKDNNIKTIMDIAAALFKEGYVNIVMAVDGPRSREFDVLLNKYNGVKGRHGFYNFKSIKFVNVGERNDSSEGIDGVSATKQRNAAKNNDFVTFTQGLPKSMSNQDAKQLFNAVRKGMGLKEAKEFKRHVQLAPVSDLREAYIRDNIFEEGEEVVMTKNGIVGNIKHLGSNYLIVESKGETWRCWLNDVSKVNPNGRPPHIEADYGETPEKGPYKLRESNDWVCGQCNCDPCTCESLDEAADKAPRWKRAGNDGEIEIKFPTGRRFKIEKFYDENLRTGNIRHKGEWNVYEWNPRTKDWEWGDTYKPKGYAKQQVMDSGQYKNGKKVADYSHTFQYESVIHKSVDEACWDTHRQVGMKAKGGKMVPNCVPKEGAFKRIAQVQSNKADRVASNDKKGLETFKKKPKEEATSSAQDRDIKDRPGSQPAKYHKGLSKAQKIARDRQFKRQTKMSDDDPKAYKPAPGDRTSKTRLSKHTLKYRKMYGED